MNGSLHWTPFCFLQENKSLWAKFPVTLFSPKMEMQHISKKHYKAFAYDSIRSVHFPPSLDHIGWKQHFLRTPKWFKSNQRLIKIFQDRLFSSLFEVTWRDAKWPQEGAATLHEKKMDTINVCVSLEHCWLTHINHL